MVSLFLAMAHLAWSPFWRLEGESVASWEERKQETTKWLFHPTAKHTLTSFKNARAACVVCANAVLPFKWEPFFPAKVAVRMSVEGSLGVLSLRNPSTYIKRLGSSSHYQSFITEFPREQMTQRPLVYSWAYQIMKFSGDSFYIYLFIYF